MATSAHQASREERRRERSSRELIAGCTKPPATFSRAPVTSGSGSCSTAARVARLTLRKQLKSSAKSTGMKLPALQHESPRVGLQSVSLQLSLEENPAEATVRARHFLLNPVNASDSPTSQHTSPSNYASIHPSTRPAMLVHLVWCKKCWNFFQSRLILRKAWVDSIRPDKPASPGSRSPSSPGSRLGRAPPSSLPSLSDSDTANELAEPPAFAHQL